MLLYIKTSPIQMLGFEKQSSLFGESRRLQYDPFGVLFCFFSVLRTNQVVEDIFQLYSVNTFVNSPQLSLVKILFDTLLYVNLYDTAANITLMSTFILTIIIIFWLRQISLN